VLEESRYDTWRCPYGDTVVTRQSANDPTPPCPVHHVDLIRAPDVTVAR
jgi:hypothetical protein